MSSAIFKNILAWLEHWPLVLGKGVLNAYQILVQQSHPTY